MVQPDVVAYSVNVQSFKEIVKQHKMARTVKSFVSIMGGPEVTVSPETFDSSDIDAYCVGEGEYAFRDFLIRVSKKESFDNISNLITKAGVTPVRNIIANLDELPKADRDLILSNSYLKDIPKKTFYTTRGCPFHCAYCCNNHYHKLYKGKGKFVRRFSAERIIQEMEYVKRHYRTDFIKIGDDLFAMKADDWLKEFVDKYKTRVNIPFNCFLRFDRISDDLLCLLKKAGCFSVHLSVDSTSEYIREIILQRSMRKVDIVDTLKKIESFGIHTWVNFMLNIPESTIQNDLDAIVVCKKAKVTYPSFGTTDPMKGTELYNYCVKKKYIDPVTHAGNMLGLFGRSTLNCFTKKEKNITYNIHLLGSIIPKLPWPFWKLAVLMIQIIPPNGLFQKLHDWYHEYSITHTIFKLTKD